MPHRYALALSSSPWSSRLISLPESRLELPREAGATAIPDVARGLFEDGQIDNSEVAAAVFLGELARSKSDCSVFDQGRNRALMVRNAWAGLARAALEKWLPTVVDDSPLAVWLKAAHADRSKRPPIAEHAGWLLAKDWLPLLDSDSHQGPWKVAELERISAAMPVGAAVGAPVLDEVARWLGSVRCADPSAWRIVGDIVRRLWNPPTRYNFYDADRAVPTDVDSRFQPDPRDWSEVLYTQHRPAAADTIDLAKVEELIALAGAPGVPNRSVHEDLYRLVDEGRFDSDATRDAMLSKVRSLHQFDRRSVSLLTIQAPDQQLEHSASVDRGEAAAGLERLGDRAHSLFLVRGEDGNCRLFETCGGKVKEGAASSVSAREVCVDPRSALARSLVDGSSLDAVVQTALLYWERHVPADQRLLVISTHGDGPRFGPTADAMVPMSALGTGLIAMDQPPVMVAFDACGVLDGQDTTPAALTGSGVRWLHGSSTSINAAGFDYRRMLSDVVREVEWHGGLGTDAPADVARWFNPSTWRNPLWRSVVPAYSGTLVGLDSGA